MKKVLQRFGMTDAKAVMTPMAAHFMLSSSQVPQVKTRNSSAVGSVMYTMVCNRPDLAYLVSFVSRFVSDPSKTHREALNWILTYLKGSQDVVLLFGSSRNDSDYMVRDVDADYAWSVDTRKSLTGYVFTMFGGVVNVM